MNWIYEPWPWYVGGPLMAAVMFALLFAGKQFGISSNLRTMCSIAGAGKVSDFFKIDLRKHTWNLLVVLGAVMGGYFASTYLSHGPVEIDQEIAQELEESYGIASASQAYLPPELFATENLSDPMVLFILITGGFLVGFGARYAGGCTSGHAISGLSNLQLPSLIAVMGFFIGGLIMIYLFYPLILPL